MRHGRVLTGPGPTVGAQAVVFGPYRIGELLGRGGMGVVHRAFDTVHERMVALKRLPERGMDAEYRARFRREARLAAGLRHPHAVPVHAFGEIDGQLYLDMALIEGVDLRRLLGDGRELDPLRALHLLGQVAGALDAAHAAGLVHRDVKPSNILIAPGDHAYLADFGIAPLDVVGIDRPDRFRRAAGQLGLPRSGAAVRGAGRRPGRPVLAGLRAVRMPRRAAAVPGGGTGGRDRRPT